MAWKPESRLAPLPGRRWVFVLLALLASSLAFASPATDSGKRALAEVLIREFEPRFSAPIVDAGTAQAWMRQQQAVFVDVREPREIAVSTVPGAITQRQFESNLAQYQGKKLVAYCTIGYRSAKFVEQWRRRGVDISNLRGGVLLWSHAGGPMVDAQQHPTSRIHVYGASWDLLPDAYLSVY